MLSRVEHGKSFVTSRPGKMDGWMSCNLTSFSTVFHSYQDDVRLITNGCIEWNLVYDWKDFRFKRGSNPGPLDQ